MEKISYNKGMKLKTFEERGISYASELALQNCKNLLTVLEWNARHDIHVFRIGSDIFPWRIKYQIEDLPDYEEISELLKLAGYYARQTDQRLTCHPDHFVKLGSIQPNVVHSAIEDLKTNAAVFDMMGFEPSYWNCINIHIGQGGDHIEVARRFCGVYKQLPDNIKSRLVVENDDYVNGFSVVQLFLSVHDRIGIPITFDYFHHSLHSDGWPEVSAFSLAYTTWPDDVIPLFHYSESKALNEGVKVTNKAHADFVFNKINDYNVDVDIDIEAKAKELAVLKYRELYDIKN